MDHLYLISGLAERVNLLNNSIFAGTVAGSPGTPPTGWTSVQATGSITAYDPVAESITMKCSATRRVIQQTANMPINSSQRFDVIVNLISGTPTVGSLAGSSTVVPTGGALQYQVNGSNVTAASTMPSGENLLSCIYTTTTDVWTMGMRMGIGVGTTATAEVEFRQPQRVLGTVQQGYERTL